ncbi:MrcB family domain-containing protein [Paenibacillus oleatilyticus]|uniref:MrcB family domain-containing protein n=1 Tax=Paenibacillus oleatilyticus TaxID=2594886 RepID=A0ABV4V228_9BACL
MPLPNELSTIFRSKQKSYEMVLILAMLEEYNNTRIKSFSLQRISELFLSHLRQREAEGKRVDAPPKKLALRWSDVTTNQLKSLINTPIQALSSVIDVHDQKQSISFKPSIWEKLDENGIEDLRNYALTEIENYYNHFNNHVAIREHLEQVMRDYISAKTKPFSGHQLGTLFRKTIPEQLRRLPFIDEHYKIQGSIGQGNWANIPWIAILDKRITETTQRGEYVVYLFAEDMSCVYLTLAQGVTGPGEKGKKESHEYLRQKVKQMRELLSLDHFQKDENIHLTTSGIGRDYQVSTVAYVRYDRDQVPDDEQLISDLENLIENYKYYVDTIEKSGTEVEADMIEIGAESLDPLPVKERVQTIQTYIRHKGFQFPDHLIENFYLSLKTKPFVILAGVSGTGKTKLVKLFAEALGATSVNRQFTLIPVRPDWSDPSDLLGYKDLSGAFRPGRLTEVLLEATKPSNRHKPYFICLDEMNLARVEHYFSDLLSVLETQEWRDGRIVTASLIGKESLTTDHDQQTFGNMYLPDNVYLVGTVNMDETTHPFSKKVLDRANTIEFNYINLAQYPDDALADDDELATQVPNSFLRSDYLQLVDVYGEYRDLVHRTTEKLVKINTILEEIHSHVGFRIRDAICFYLIYNERFQLLSEDAALDMQLLQKILPRVQGSGSSVKRALLQLMEVALDKSLPIQKMMDDPAEPNFKWNAGSSSESVKYPQSARKIGFMLRRLEEDGFTSYWLS